jgi:hypothetical protein
MDMRMTNKTVKSKSKDEMTKAASRKPGKRFYSQQLNWVLHFVNAHIHGLPHQDFLKVFDEFLSFFYGSYIDDPDLLRQICKDTKSNRDELDRIQMGIKGTLNIIYDYSNKGRRQSYSVLLSLISRPVYRVQFDEDRLYWVPVKELLPWKASPIDAEEAEVIYWRVANGDYLKTGFDPEEKVAYEIFDRWEKEPPFPWEGGEENNAYVDPNIGATILTTLIPLLEKFPRNVIKTCEVCSKFFRATRKKKRPMCRACLKKESVYEWRKKNPEVYRIYQRDLQKGVKRKPKEIKAELEGEGKLQKN